MEQIFKMIKYFFISILFISCNSKEVKNSTAISNKILSHNFPDTVKLNKVISGSLQYDINDIGFESDSISSRFLQLLLTTSINKGTANYSQVDNNRLLSYLDTVPTGTFKFYAVFEKKGKQTLNIVIRDHMYLKSNGKLPKDKMVLRTTDCLFSKVVYVVK